MSYKCKQCSKCYATRQSRWKHQQHCRGADLEQEAKGMVDNYRKSDYQTFCGDESADGSTNAKSRKLVNEIVNEDDDDIPYFDGDEFSGKITKSRETLNRMMKMLKIPEERWERIATGVLEEERAERDASSLTSEEELPFPEKARDLSDIEMTPPVEFSSSGDVTSRFEDGDPFEDLDVKNLWNRFKVLHHQLLRDKKRENTNKLISILDTLLRRDLIDLAGYKKAFDKVMADQRECTQ